MNRKETIEFSLYILGLFLIIGGIIYTSTSYRDKTDAEIRAEIDARVIDNPTWVKEVLVSNWLFIKVTGISMIIIGILMSAICCFLLDREYKNAKKNNC